MTRVSCGGTSVKLQSLSTLFHITAVGGLPLLPSLFLSLTFRTKLRFLLVCLFQDKLESMAMVGFDLFERGAVEDNAVAFDSTDPPAVHVGPPWWIVPVAPKELSPFSGGASRQAERHGVQGASLSAIHLGGGNLIYDHADDPHRVVRP